MTTHIVWDVPSGHDQSALPQKAVLTINNEQEIPARLKVRHGEDVRSFDYKVFENGKFRKP